VGVAELVDVDVDPGCGAVALPPVVGGSGRRLQITLSSFVTSAALAGRGRVLGTLMVSIRSIGLAARRLWRTAHRQKEATAARLRLRVAAARAAASVR
jgi:hypothetical protein